MLRMEKIQINNLTNILRVYPQSSLRKNIIKQKEMQYPSFLIMGWRLCFAGNSGVRTLVPTTTTKIPLIFPYTSVNGLSKVQKQSSGEWGTTIGGMLN